MAFIVHNGARMNTKTTACMIIGISAMLLSSCITSTLVAASGAVAGADALVKTTSSGIKSISDVFSSDAPESLNGHTLVINGESRVATGTEKVEKSLCFTSDNACKDSASLFKYERSSDTKAIVTETVNGGAETHTYRLTFTDGDEGVYSYESRLADGAVVATGDGSFSLSDND